jgi:hypothetical protein
MEEVVLRSSDLQRAETLMEARIGILGVAELVERIHWLYRFQIISGLKICPVVIGGYKVMR